MYGYGVFVIAALAIFTLWPVTSTTAYPNDQLIINMIEAGIKPNLKVWQTFPELKLAKLKISPRCYSDLIVNQGQSRRVNIFKLKLFKIFENYYSIFSKKLTLDMPSEAMGSRLQRLMKSIRLIASKATNCTRNKLAYADLPALNQDSDELNVLRISKQASTSVFKLDLLQEKLQVCSDIYLSCKEGPRLCRANNALCIFSILGNAIHQAAEKTDYRNVASPKVVDIKVQSNEDKEVINFNDA